jgi:GR25 family glycosyltransferase involved in LPS biosynthesis
MSPLPFDQVYVTHYTPLRDRRKSLERALAILGIDATWITDYDREALTQHEFDTFVQQLDSSWTGKDIHFQDIDFHHMRYQPLNASEISLSLKHAEALKQFCESGGQLALVLEDDVLFRRDFVDECNRFLRQTPGDFGIIFPGDGCGLRVHSWELRPGQVAYRVLPPMARCTDSYIITRAAAKKLLDHLLPIFLPADVQFTYWLRTLNIPTYWWDPNLITQGSQLGIYEGSIRDRPDAMTPEPLTVESRKGWLIPGE